MYVEINNLPAALDRYGKGPLHARLAQFPAWSEWVEAESENLHALQDSLTQLFGLEWDKLSEDILGGRIALAMWPVQASNNQTDTPQRSGTLIVLQSQDAESLQTVAAGFREMQSTFGIKWSPQDAGGETIHVGIDSANPEQTRFALATVGQTAFLADSTEICQAALKLYADAATPQNSVPQSSLAGVDSFQTAVSTLPPTSDAIAFLNPVPWQGVLEQRILALPTVGATEDNDAQARLQQTLATWKSLSYAAASLELNSDMQFSGVMQFDEAKLPAPLEAFLQSASGETKLLQAIPADCLAAVALHLDLSKLPGWFSEGPGASSILRQMISALGTDFGAHLAEVGNPPWLEDRVGDTAQGATGDRIDAGPFPLAWVFEMSLRTPINVAELPSDYDAMLREAMPELMNLAFRATSSQWLSNLRTLVDQGAQLSSLEEWTLFAAGDSTTYGLKNGFVLASSSAEAIAEFRAQTDVPTLADDDVLGPMILRPVFGEAPNQVVFLNCRRLREFLSRRGIEIADAIADAQEVTPTSAKLAVARMVEVLSLADYVTATAHVAPDRVAVSLHISADESVGK